MPRARAPWWLAAALLVVTTLLLIAAAVALDARSGVVPVMIGLGVVWSVLTTLVLLEASRVQRRARAAAEQAARTDAALREARGLRDHLVAVVGHEMRTPLTALRGFLELLETGVPEGPDRDLLQRCEVLTRRLRLLSEDLLTAASSGRSLSLSPAEVPVAEAVRECLRSFPDLRAETEVPPDLVVRADPLRLQQVLANLVRNAQKYGAEPVRVTARPGRGGDADTVEIDVSDAGPGVPAAFVGRLFERYARAEGTGVIGSGLGLSLVRDLVEAQRGMVSYLPDGHVFRVSLPRVDHRRPEPLLGTPAGHRTGAVSG